MITNEAIEVAAIAMAGFDPWPQVPESRKSVLRRDARRALQAAALFMASADYDRGFDDGHRAGQESMEGME